ncbi:MAG: LemA family protein [Endomicrobiaceae bacterium]|nr:LemA family protein [Endomicrobiaceae bacterium]
MVNAILIILLVFCLLLVIIAVFLWSTYNRLILLRNRMKEAWSDIEVLLKRRYDLIPNLVEVVKGYAAHEKATLEAVIKARNMAISTDKKTVEQQAQSENILSGTLKSLFAVSEKYPDLKANENFLELQKELVDTENKIQASRRFYNTNVLALNTKIEMFPSNIIANFFHFEKGQFFNLENKEEKEPVKVSF